MAFVLPILKGIEGATGPCNELFKRALATVKRSVAMETEIQSGTGWRRMTKGI